MVAIIIILILIFLLILYFYFSIAFVKHNIGNVDDVNDPVNKPLQKHKELISKGIEYNKNEPHNYVFTKSFDGLILAARYYDNRSDKTILLFHGYRSSAMRDFACAVEMYKNFGFNVLLCDQRSHGRSEGKLITFGVKEKFDVISWVNFISYKYSPKKIVLGGMSMGATTVLLALGEKLNEKVSAVIADCGFTSPKEIILKVAKDKFKINAKFILPLINLYCLFFGKFSIYNNDTRNSIKKSDIPILLIHGENDNFVPYEMSLETFKNANKKSDILIVKNADHGLSFLIDSVLVKDRLKKFLKECNLY